MADDALIRGDPAHPRKPRPVDVGLAVADLRKAFGDVKALDGMTWSAPLGRITALLGPNGAGKTTAFRCVAGVLYPDGGDVTIFGRPASDPGARDGISFLPEDPELYPSLTLAEHLRFIALAHRMENWRDRAEELVARFQLTEVLEAVPSEMSQGQRRKTALVAALLHGAQVLLFDEPFNGLDPQASVELRTILEDLRTEGAAVVVSTHVLSSAERFVDRAVIVHRGVSLAEGTMEDLRRIASSAADADLEAVFLSLTGRAGHDVGSTLSPEHIEPG